MTKLRQAITDYAMIENGDKVAVGVSGGKDSLALAEALNKYRKRGPLKFELIVVHLKMGFPGFDIKPVQDFFRTEGVEFIAWETEIFSILTKNRNNDGSLKCSLCSKFKKALVIQAAQAFNCNKVAFAHHGDDAIETLFLNAIFGGRIATFRPKMYLSETAMEFIRPFIYLRESEISNYARQQALPIIPSACPNDGFTKRAEIKELLNEIYRKYPEAYHNFLIMLANNDKLDLWQKETD